MRMFLPCFLLFSSIACALSAEPARVPAQQEPYRLEFRPNNPKILDLSSTFQKYAEDCRKITRMNWHPNNEGLVPPMAIAVQLSKISFGMDRREVEDALGKQWVEFSSDKYATEYMSRQFPGFVVYIKYAVALRPSILGRPSYRSGPDSAILDRPAVVATKLPSSWIPEPYQPPLPFAYNRPPFPRRSIVVRGNGYNLQPRSPTP